MRTWGSDGDWSDEDEYAFDEGDDRDQTPLPEQITRELLLQAEHVQIDVVDGQPVMGYRVLRYLGDFSEWETVPRAEDVREIQAENLWFFVGAGLSEGLMPVLGSDHDGPWPDVYPLAYGSDPETDEPFWRYGAWVMSSGKITVNWYADQGQARKLHQACVDHLETERRRHQAYKAEVEKQRPWQEAYGRCCELLDDKVLAKFGRHLDHQAGLVQAVLREEHKHSGFWTSAEDFLDGARALDAASQGLASALETLKEERRLVIREHNLVARLAELLRLNIQLCPLCFEPYQRDEEWLERLLMEGEAFLGFEDRESVSWSADEDALPSRIAEFFQARKHTPQFLTVLESDNPQDPYEGRRILLRHLEVGGVTVARFVGLLECNGESPLLKSRQQLIEEGDSEENVDRYLADYLPYEYVSPVVLVDIEALAQASPQDSGRLVDDWSVVWSKYSEQRLAQAEEEVRTGKAVKLRFRWDERRKRWSSWLREGEHKTVWVLDAAVTDSLNPNGVYFCHIVRTPPRAQTPTLSFHVVRPFLLAETHRQHMRSDISY